MSDDEFVRTNPWLVSNIEVFSVDDPGDQPAYIGVVMKCVSQRAPMIPVTFTFKLPPQLAGEPAAALSLLAE